MINPKRTEPHFFNRSAHIQRFDETQSGLMQSLRVFGTFFCEWPVNIFFIIISPTKLISNIILYFSSFCNHKSHNNSFQNPYDSFSLYKTLLRNTRREQQSVLKMTSFLKYEDSCVKRKITLLFFIAFSFVLVPKSWCKFGATFYETT